MKIGGCDATGGFLTKQQCYVCQLHCSTIESMRESTARICQYKQLQLCKARPGLLSRQGSTNFPQIIEATLKFYAPEGDRETNSISRNSKY